MDVRCGCFCKCGVLFEKRFRVPVKGRVVDIRQV